MIPDDETCESCGVAVHPDDLVRTADDVVLHRACAREIWPLARAGAERIGDMGTNKQVESCQHGTPWSQHCCNCHSGMLFLGQGCRCDAATAADAKVIGRIGSQIRRLESHRDYGPECPAGEYWYRPDVEVEMASVIRAAKAQEAGLSPDDFYALRRIIEVLPVADTLLTSLQVKLSAEENRQHGNVRHPSQPEFMREMVRVEALIRSRLQPASGGQGMPLLRQAVGAGASRGGEMKQGRYYGQPLKATIADGRLVIAIGVQTLAHASAYADWANPFDETADDYIRTFAIEDAPQFAKDVVGAMLAEREDGSTPLSDFLDKMAQAAIGDGSLGLHEDEQHIKHGTFAPCETWSVPAEGDR